MKTIDDQSGGEMVVEIYENREKFTERYLRSLTQT
jgi:hypothetical protein